ncbi:MAG: N-formylglutamate amidohydrolase [Alphaproteobacteria bacterium]
MSDPAASSAVRSLLGPGDPPAVTVVNGGGKGDCLLLCDHASHAIPKSLGGLGLGPVDLARHIAGDIGASSVARHLSVRFDAPVVLAGFSRLVIDCNRGLDDPTSIPLISETTVIPGNRAVSTEEHRHRAQSCFEPYHRRVRGFLDGFAARGIVPLILSIHSFTPVFKGVARPWHFGILWNRDPRVPRPLIAGLARMPGVVVGDNEPYSGQDEYGYTIESHGAKRGLPHVLIEVRDDLIRDEAGVSRWAGILGDALAPILANPALRRVERF